jgi:MFS family permease
VRAFQLGIMMFLQYAIWGAYAPVLSAYLENDLGFSGVQVGAVYSLLPLATIIAPFIGGQLADRYFSSERIIGVLQLVVPPLRMASTHSFTCRWVGSKRRPPR